MDFGFTDDDAAFFPRYTAADAGTGSVGQPAQLSFAEMLDRIEHLISADSALRGTFTSRFAATFAEAEKAKVRLDPFPILPGTVELSIWDNQPRGKRSKVAGDTSRDRPARYALSIRAFNAGCQKPLTSKTPDFNANVGDLFTAEEIRARIKRVWKGMSEEEVAFLNENILPVAETGFLVARLCYKASAKKGGGTHWHDCHYALVSQQQLEDRAVEGVLIVTGEATMMLPACSTLDAKGKPFQLVSKTTKSGAVRESLVVGQSRATDLTTPGMKAWATGEIQRA